MDSYIYVRLEIKKREREEKKQQPRFFWAAEISESLYRVFFFRKNRPPSPTYTLFDVS